MLSSLRAFSAALFFAAVWARGPATADEWPLDPANGWQEAVVSVSDLDSWQAYMVSLAEWRPVTKAPVDPRQLRQWGLKDGVTAEQVVMQNPGETQGLVRFIKFAGAEQVQIRSSAQPWDTGGIFSLLVRSPSVDRNFETARRYDWTGYNDPVDLKFGGSHLRNVILRGPDGVNFGVYERVTPPLEGFPNMGPMTRPFNAMQIVDDKDATMTFFQGVLGFTAMTDTRYTPADASANNFGLPKNYVTEVALKAGILHPTGGNTGRVEIVQWDGFTGRDLKSRAVPPNLGILSLRYPVPDAEARAAEIAATGWSIWSQPKRIDLPPYGPVVLFGVRSPDGVIIEFFSRS